MPFDLMPDPARPRQTRAQRAVATWLFVLAGMILVMVSLGGATRLTGSGLSIMEWAPLMGTLPPLSEAEWQRLYTLYQHIPQYSLVNEGFGLAGFKGIFWLEWTHRLWGRLMGLVFALPLLWFAVRGRIGRGLALRLLGLLMLGGLQGLVGWLMVASGFEAERTSVSPYRLVAHLALATALYAAMLWTALDVWRAASRTEPAVGASRALRRMVGFVCAMLGLTIIAGGFVAGLKAGLVYNSFPFMDGHVIPEGYQQLHPLYLNMFENVAAVQFDHRCLATLSALLVLVTVGIGLQRAAGTLRTMLLVLGAAVLMQYALGVLTLIWAVPPLLGTLHQVMAMVLLTTALVTLHLLRGTKHLLPGAARMPPWTPRPIA